jgi:hypothetical protein
MKIGKLHRCLKNSFLYKINPAVLLQGSLVLQLKSSSFSLISFICLQLSFSQNSIATLIIVFPIDSNLLEFTLRLASIHSDQPIGMYD